MLTRDSTELTDPGVVPSLADRWSHHTGGTHLKVVPCHWRATGGMKANDAKRLKELEAENARLKKLLAEAELDKSMLKELAKGNF